MFTSNWGLVLQSHLFCWQGELIKAHGLLCECIYRICYERWRGAFSLKFTYALIICLWKMHFVPIFIWDGKLGRSSVIPSLKDYKRECSEVSGIMIGCHLTLCKSYARNHVLTADSHMRRWTPPFCLIKANQLTISVVYKRNSCDSWFLCGSECKNIKGDRQGIMMTSPCWWCHLEVFQRCIRFLAKRKCNFMKK